MTPKFFVTGATGYIGGDALHAIITAHPDWSYTCLVRNSDKGATLVSRYAQIRLVYGDLSSTDLILTEAHNADIVCHFASADDEPSARAIAAGLASKSPSEPGYWIHTSGTGILVYPDLDRKIFGEDSSKVYDDVDDIAEVTSFPSHALHRKIDEIVLGSARSPVKTAIVCPPTIYGVGRGTGNTRSIQLPGLIRCSLDRGAAFQVGAGKARWSNVHVHDLSMVYLLLAEDAAAGGRKASWGENGYYFTENGEHVWGQVAIEVAKRAQKLGMLESTSVDSVPAKKADELRVAGSVLWGANSCSRASRARKELGWTPKGEPMVGTIDDVLKMEQRDIQAGTTASQHV